MKESPDTRGEAQVDFERLGGNGDSQRRSRVINRAYVKAWALDYARTNRSHKFTRVSEDFLNMVEASTKAFIIHRVQSAPSKGVTLK